MKQLPSRGFILAVHPASSWRTESVLEGALQRLRAKGLRAVEAYPQKESDGTAQGNYRGPLEMYLLAGFEPYRQSGRTLIVGKTLYLSSSDPAGLAAAMVSPKLVTGRNRLSSRPESNLPAGGPHEGIPAVRRRPEA
jgi:hypothetical protein